jgi:eukaryotic-like serine/threonine-protein kinase
MASDPRRAGWAADSATEIEGLPSPPLAGEVPSMVDRATGNRRWMRGNLLDGRYALDRSVRLSASTRRYLGTHIAIQRRVLVDVMRSAVATDAVAREEFERRALALASIKHPNLERILDLSLGEPPYVVREYESGRTLAELVAECGPLDALRAVRVTIQLCGALAAAHLRGVTHGQLRLDSVVLANRGDGVESPKLVDFALTATGDSGPLVSADDWSSVEVTRPGTPNDDARGDVVALVRVLHQMLLGAVAEEPPAPSRLRAAVVRTAREPFAARLVAVVTRGMSRTPAERFSSARQLEEALRDLVVAPPSGSWASIPPRRQRRVGRFVALWLLLIALVGVAAFWLARR